MNSAKPATQRAHPWKTDFIRTIGLIAMAMTAIPTRLAAREFQNLDFEAAMVPTTPVGGQGGPVDPALAFPGWTMGTDGTQARNVTGYNVLTLGSVAQILIGPEFPNRIAPTALGGSYSALLQFGPLPEAGIPALIQTGVIPADARSINFLAPAPRNDARLTVDGTAIPLVAIGDRLAGDVSAFAGEEVELTFSTNRYSGPWLYFDDVQFSSATIPEPSVATLAAMSVLPFLRRARRCHQ